MSITDDVIWLEKQEVGLNPQAIFQQMGSILKATLA